MNIFFELFLSTNLWGYLGPIGLVIIGYVLSNKDKFLGVLWLVVESLIISHYLTLVEATPEYWWHIIILLLGVIQCAFQMMKR